MEELYAALLLKDVKGDITDRDIANLLETAGYDVSLYDTNEFLTFVRNDDVTLVKDNVISKWEKSVEEGISETWNDGILENYELKFHIDRDVIRITLAFLIHHAADREINKKRLIQTFETVGLTESWVKDRNLNHLIREYYDGEFGEYLKKLNKEVIAGLSQSNVDIIKIRVIDEELSKNKNQEDESTEDESTEDEIVITNRAKNTNHYTASARNDEIENSVNSRKSSPTEVESHVSQEEKIQSIRSEISKIDSFIVDAEFNKARQILDDVEKQINELKQRTSHEGSGTVDEELQQLEQKCNNRLSKSGVLTQLREIDPYEFEAFVAKIWEKEGWDTEIKSGSGDRGVDVEATKEDALEKRRHLIQVKRHGENTAVGSEDIQRYASLYQRDEQVDKVFVVTSNRFTSEAKEVAESRDVSTIDSDELYEMLTKRN